MERTALFIAIPLTTQMSNNAATMARRADHVALPSPTTLPSGVERFFHRPGFL